MGNQIWKTLNAILGFAVFGVGVQGYDSLREFSFWSGLVIAAVIALIVFEKRKLRPKSRIGLYVFLPVFFLVGLFGTLLTVSPLGVRVFLAGAGALLFYFHELWLPSAVPAFLEQVYGLAGGILVLTFLMGVNFFFTPPWWLVSVLALVLFGGFFFQFYLKKNEELMPVLVRTFVSVLILVETLWVVLFWPSHFLVTAVAVFAVFYLITVLGDLQLAGRLTRKQIYFQVGIISVVLLFSFLTAQWQV